MARTGSAGAKVWALVLSELAQVPVVLEFQHPAWRVCWVDGPTAAQLADRAKALSRFRVGAPLTTERMWFQRSSSPVAAALTWLRHGSPETTDLPRARSTVETWLEELPYPQRCFPPTVLAAAELLARLRSDPYAMGTLMAQAFPPMPPVTLDTAVVDRLPGQVSSISWPGKLGPPPELLGTTPTPAPASASASTSTSTSTKVSTADPSPACEQCGRELAAPPNGPGRPARFCSGACRTAAHRQRRTAFATS
jgi:hypothetical protein